MIQPKTGGFSWDPENREKVQSIAQALKGFGAEGKPPSMPELFLLCAVLGWRDGFRKAVVASNGQARETNVPYRYFNEQPFNMLVSIGLAEEEDAQILLEDARLFKVVEEYAAGGLSLLVKAHESSPSLEVWLQAELYKLVQENRIAQ